MAVLELNSRPWTVFDPCNREHRKYYANFVRSRGWGNCPVRFVVPDGSQDLLTMIRSSLVKYYLDRDFPDKAMPFKRKRA
jgi:hypothetical protein